MNAPHISLVPIFQENGKEFFYINQTVVEKIRSNSLIYYFDQVFWDNNPKPLGMEKLHNIVADTSTGKDWVMIIARWKYLDKFARYIGSNERVPADPNIFVKEYQCYQVDLPLDLVKGKSEGWMYLPVPEQKIEELVEKEILRLSLKKCGINCIISVN